MYCIIWNCYHWCVRTARFPYCSQCLVHGHFRHALTDVSKVALEYRQMLQRALTEEGENLNLLNKKVDKCLSDLNLHERRGLTVNR